MLLVGEILSVGVRQGVLLGVNSTGTVRIRFQDTGEDDEIDPAEASLTVEAL